VDEDTAKQHIELGNTKYLNGDFKGAIREYTETIKIDPENVVAYISRALSRAKAADIEGAIVDYTVVIRLDPTSQIAYNNRGLLKLERGDNDGAIADFTRSLSVYQRSFASYGGRGKARFNKGDYEGAIADLTAAIKINHRPVEPYYLRANARLKLGDKEGAIADFTGAIAGNADYAPLYNERGMVKFDIGDYNGAIGDYSRAIRVDPNYVAAYNNRGIAKHKRARYDEAIEDLTEALRIDPQHAPAYANRANVRKDIGDCSGAIYDFTQAVRFDPKDALSYRRRGHVYYDTGRWLDALRDLSKAVQLDSGARDEDYDLLRIWLITARLGKRSEANALLDGRLKSRTPGKIGDWYRNLCLFLLGRISEDALIKAAEDPDLKKATEQKCEAYFYTGSLHIIEGDLEGGLRLLRLCVGTAVDSFTEYDSAVAEIESILFGAHFEPAGEEVRTVAVLDRNVGFVVSNIAADSPAQAAGIKLKDVLREINGMPATKERLKQLCEIGKPGEIVNIAVMRQYQRVNIELKLGGKNSLASPRTTSEISASRR
jgi:tetratricopeptide (TPR) repeat protein